MRKMVEYHVGCGAFAIYAGTLNSRNKNLWQNKSEVTDEAVSAVAQYLLQENKEGCKKILVQGRLCCLK